MSRRANNLFLPDILRLIVVNWALISLLIILSLLIPKVSSRSEWAKAHLGPTSIQMDNPAAIFSSSEINLSTATPFLSPSPEETTMATPLSLSSSNPVLCHRFSPTTLKFKTPVRSSKFKILAAIPPISTTAVDFPAIDGTTIAAIGGGSLAALAAVISISDPEKRRRIQAEEVGGGDKEVVREYFNNSGFQRWRKIYGETDEVNRVQLDIRLGHSKTVENVIQMLKDEGPLAGLTVCDAGCGTGCLSIPLAKEGAVVSASDISAAMVAEAEMQAKKQLLTGNDDTSSPPPILPKFEVKDLESLAGKYDTVVCLDVLIHYPQNKADGMIAHLASLAENRLILSFAPKTFYYNLLKRVGELFPGPSKATRAYLHAEQDVENALRKVGWKIRKRGLITTQFYFSRIVEAVPA